MVDKLEAMAMNANEGLVGMEANLKNYSSRNLNKKSDDSLSSMMDLIYTPGSVFRYANKDSEESSKLANYTLNTMVLAAEGFRGVMYYALGTILHPVVPLGMILTGLMGYLFNKNKENK